MLGPEGPRGLKGSAGTHGLKGSRGEPGNKGMLGPEGPRGSKGTAGAPGLKGSRGEQGNRGILGPIGPIGPRGYRGAAGAPGFKGSRGDPGRPAQLTSGAVYIRWGKSLCPGGTELLYGGFAGGTWFSYQGGAADFLCLPNDPQYLSYVPGENTFSYSKVCGAEYEIGNGSPSHWGFDRLHDHRVPCAVCHATGRPSTFMLPAKYTCPFGWTREYYGYLMTTADTLYNNHHRTKYVCMDYTPDSLGRSTANGALFYLTEANCGVNVPCGSGKYDKEKELTCAVCTK